MVCQHIIYNIKLCYSDNVYKLSSNIITKIMYVKLLFGLSSIVGGGKCK